MDGDLRSVGEEDSFRGGWEIADFYTYDCTCNYADEERDSLRERMGNGRILYV